MTDLEIFHNAPENGTPEELAAYLYEACGDDAELRGKVESLLAMGNRTDDFLERAAMDFDAATMDSEGNASRKSLSPTAISAVHASSEKGGDVIGPFTLIEKLGEGGFGTVWKAEQQVPIARTVALKIIKLGMDTREVLTRFGAERQALAMMSHENIAKVLDAGATEGGRPFFVMELVDGVPITKYCDNHQFDTRERLELLRDVCAAVNHAHQKGMIHRDIKPSNVMVTEQDGKPVVKVIDFGIAKATESGDAGQTMLTLQEQVIGTPAYMSPEQAGMDGLDIDTRSDIYSLGVLLYEVLSGKPPFDPKTLLSAGFDEMRRIVREEEPPRPSLLVSGISDASEGETFLTTHGAGPQKLSRILRGDLDWIVMKAIEKDRGRRYETANAFAADIGRFLADEPVVAAKPSVGYQLQKFARRNKVALGVASTIAAVLIAATAVSSWQAVIANRAAKRATEAEAIASARLEESEAISSFLTNVFQSPEPGRDGRTVTVAEILDTAAKTLDADLADQPDRRAVLQHTLGQTYRRLGLSTEAIALLEKNFELRLSLNGREHPDTLETMGTLGRAYFAEGRYEEAISLRKELLAMRRRLDGDAAPETIGAMTQLATSLAYHNRDAEALALREEAAALAARELGPKHYATGVARTGLAESYSRAGRHEEAIALVEDHFNSRREALGEKHPVTVEAMRLLASTYGRADRLEEAIPLAELSLQSHQEVFGDSHHFTRIARLLLGELYRKKGRLAESIVILEALAKTERLNQVPVRHRVPFVLGLADSYQMAERHEEALALRERALALCRSDLRANDHQTIRALRETADSYEQAGRIEEATALREEAARHTRSTSEGETRESGEEVESQPLPSDLGEGIVEAITLAGEKRGNEAAELSKELRKQIGKLEGPGRLQALISMEELAGLFANADVELAEARAIRQASLAASLEVNGPDHDQTGYALLRVSQSQFAAGQYDEALTLREQALEIAKKNPQSRLILYATNALAGSLIQAERFEEGLALKEQALPLAQQFRGREDAMTLGILAGLAHAYARAGRYDEAVERGEELVTIRRKLDRELKDPMTVTAMKNLVGFYEAAGNKEKAEALRAELPASEEAEVPEKVELKGAAE